MLAVLVGDVIAGTDRTVFSADNLAGPHKLQELAIFIQSQPMAVNRVHDRVAMALDGRTVRSCDSMASAGHRKWSGSDNRMFWSAEQVL